MRKTILCPSLQPRRSLFFSENNRSMESGKSKPKARFSTRLPNGDYLQIAVWPGKSDPSGEVLNAQIRHMSDGEWVTAGKLALYRAKDGSYTQLPDRLPTPPSKASDKQTGQNEPSTDVG